MIEKKIKLADALAKRNIILIYMRCESAFVFVVANTKKMKEKDVIEILKEEGVKIKGIEVGKFATESIVEKGYWCELC